MNSLLILSAIGGLNDEMVYAAKVKGEKKVTYFPPLRKRIAVIAAIIAILLLCGFAAYQAGLFDPWIQKPSVVPVETVQSAIEGQLEKEYTIAVQIDEIKVDNEATRRARKFYQESELAKRNGWTSEYIESNMIVVHAKYYVEYDHEKTFLPDGETEQFFILIQDEKTQEWTIWDCTTNGDPFLPGGDAFG